MKKLMMIPVVALLLASNVARAEVGRVTDPSQLDARCQYDESKKTMEKERANFSQQPGQKLESEAKDVAVTI